MWYQTRESDPLVENDGQIEHQLMSHINTLDFLAC